MQTSNQGTGTDQTGTKTEDNRFLNQSLQLPFQDRSDQWLDRVAVLSHHHLLEVTLSVHSNLHLQGRLRLQGNLHLHDRQLLLESQHHNLLSSLHLFSPHHRPLNPPLGHPRTLAPPLGILQEVEEAPVVVD